MNVIERLLAECPGAEPEIFETSGWMDDGSRSVESVIKEYEQYFLRRLDEIKSLLGEPDRTDITHRNEIAQWYPEAIRAACWIRQGNTVCLALEQSDRETPVIVLLRCLSADEIADLSM